MNKLIMGMICVIMVAVISAIIYAVTMVKNYKLRKSMEKGFTKYSLGDGGPKDK